jgi:hypothetical protein
MDNLITMYTEFLNEAKNPTESFEQFAENRLAGATNISNMAKEKGGDAMLTYHHFVVKLPYYKKAAQGKFDQEKMTNELESLTNKLIDGTKSGLKLKQVDFQKLVGLIEVVGELLIRFEQKK